jgi:hypothetical protein
MPQPWLRQSSFADTVDEFPKGALRAWLEATLQVERVRTQAELESRHAHVVAEFEAFLAHSGWTQECATHDPEPRSAVFSLDDLCSSEPQSGVYAEDETWQKGDLVQVEGRTATVKWDGHPEHAFAKLVWADTGTESGIISVDRIKFQAKAPCGEVDLVAENNVNSADVEETTAVGIGTNTINAEDIATPRSRRPSVLDDVRTAFASQRCEIECGILGEASSRSLGEEGSSYRELLRVIVTSGKFESFFAALILLNVFCMAVQVQYRGGAIAERFRYTSTVETDMAIHNVHWLVDLLHILEFVFGVFFTAEITLKLLALGCREMWRDLWHWIDFIIVLCWLAGNLRKFKLPLNPLLIRLVRLVRILRLVKLMRKMQAMDALVVILTSIKCSISILVWSIAVLAIGEMALGLIAQQLLMPYMENEAEPYEKRQRVFLHFGTFTRCWFTMLELTFGGWARIGRMLTEDVNGWWSLPILAHQFVIGFAVLTVVRGVFMQQTFKVAETDNFIMMKTRKREARVHKTKMRSLFAIADTDNDGYLDFHEFTTIMSNNWVKEWLFAYGLMVDDVGKMWTLIDRNHDSKISIDELVSGMRSLRGTARSIDMKFLMHDINVLEGLRKSRSEISSIDSPVSPFGKIQIGTPVGPHG